MTKNNFFYVSRNCFASLFLWGFSQLSENVSKRTQRKHSVPHAFFFFFLVVFWLSTYTRVVTAEAGKSQRKQIRDFLPFSCWKVGNLYRILRKNIELSQNLVVVFFCHSKATESFLCLNVIRYWKISKESWLIFNQASEVNKLFLDQNSMLFCLLPY